MLLRDIKIHLQPTVLYFDSFHSKVKQEDNLQPTVLYFNSFHSKVKEEDKRAIS